MNRWNLLLMAGGMGFSILSGHPEVGIPLVLAAETAYLGLLGTHPKFQSYVNAQAAKEKRSHRQSGSQTTLNRILEDLPKQSLKRYERLKKRCHKLGKIASNMKEPNTFGSNTMDSLHTRGLDRLLWVFLKLQHSRHMLVEFQKEVSEEKMTDELRTIEKRLEVLGDDNSVDADKIRRTLLDNQATLKERKENYAQAKSNFLFIDLELDRVENKIKSISEMSVNRRDPEYISGQIDAVANSMKDTERTMNDLQFISNIGELEDDAPELFEGKTKRLAGIQNRR
jgi:hypothetical protein